MYIRVQGGPQEAACDMADSRTLKCSLYAQVNAILVAWDGPECRQSDGIFCGGFARLSRTYHMGWRQRLRRTVLLWPYMVPLTLVYFAEYAMQAG